MELGPQNHNGDGLLGPNSIIVVYMDPLGSEQAAGYALLRPPNPKPLSHGVCHEPLSPKPNSNTWKLSPRTLKPSPKGS